jgi:hypothetical protein
MGCERTSRCRVYVVVRDEGGSITRGIVDGVPSPVSLIGIAEKGYVSLQLSTRAAGGHLDAILPLQTGRPPGIRSLEARLCRLGRSHRPDLSVGTSRVRPQ